MDQKLLEYFKKHTIVYEIIEHAPVFTVREADNLRIPFPKGTAHTKNLFMKDEKKNYYLISLEAHDRLNTKKLKKQLVCKELEFASPEELNEELHLTPGSVSPFGLIHATKTRYLIDKKLWHAEKLGFHPNQNNATFIITHSTFEQWLKSLPIQFKIVSIT
ncbi:MAG TPA: YbaK/EbsC family protein [Candidatus Nanoarchaeia archaeon]|nr:YbaK/EbsC family protein [Candidatus Nanoarchaeia archaeon]